MEKHSYHIRLNPHAVALVDEGCPQETINALLKMSELVLKTYEDYLDLTEQGVSDKSGLTSKTALGEDGLVNLSTSPFFKTLAKSKNYAEILRDIHLILLGMKFFREDLDINSDENIKYAMKYYESICAAGKI